jgi:hypothetical protein
MTPEVQPNKFRCMSIYFAFKDNKIKHLKPVVVAVDVVDVAV